MIKGLNMGVAAAAVVLVLGVVGYLDLRNEIADIRNPVAESEPVLAEGTTPDPVEAQQPGQEVAPAQAPAQAAPAQAAPGEVGVELVPSEGNDRASNWNCEGSVAPEAVQQQLGEHGRAIFACHAEHGQGQEVLLQLHLKIGPQGQVSQIHIPGLPASPLTTCVSEVSTRFRFPPIASECAIVLMPFTFGAGS